MEIYQKEFVRVKEILKANPKGMTVTDVSRAININRNSVAKYLDVLLISGHVEMRSIGPAKVFFLSHRVPLSAMLNFSSDYILVLDKDLKIVQVNDNLTGFMKIERESLLGQKIEDCPFFANMLSKIKKTFEGKDTTMETSFKKAGKEFYFRIKLIPTTFEDGEPGVTILAESITERKNAEEKIKESEEKYRKIFELSPEAIGLLDRKGNMLDINGRVHDWLDYRPEEVIGKNILELPFLTKESKTKIKENFARRMLGEEVPPYEVDFITKGGERVLGRIIATPIRDAEGKIIQDLVMISEITGRNLAKKRK